jgi:hypothetical protein
MKKIFHFLLLIFIVLISCSRETGNCSDNVELCKQLQAADYSKSLATINEYLQTLDYDENNSTLETLLDWLECTTCVTKAEINCYWCEYSNPPHGSIIFNLSQSTETLQLNLFGSIPHEAGSITKK